MHSVWAHKTCEATKFYKLGFIKVLVTVTSIWILSYLSAVQKLWILKKACKNKTSRSLGKYVIYSSLEEIPLQFIKVDATDKVVI